MFFRNRSQGDPYNFIRPSELDWSWDMGLGIRDSASMSMLKRTEFHILYPESYIIKLFY